MRDRDRLVVTERQELSHDARLAVLRNMLAGDGASDGDAAATLTAVLDAVDALRRRRTIDDPQAA